MSEKNNNCLRCEKRLGFRKLDPEDSNWGFEKGKLCSDCFDYIKNGIKKFDANYVEGYSRFPFKMEGKLFIQTFDERNTVIFDPKKKTQYEIMIPPEKLVDCNIVTKKEDSIARRMLTANISKSKEKKLFKLDFLDASNNNKLEGALFELDQDDDLNNVHNMIFLIKGKAKNEIQSENRSDLNTQQAPGQLLEPKSISDSNDVQLVMEEKTFCNKCDTECDMENKYCSNCGNLLLEIVTENQKDDESEVMKIKESYDSEKEKAFFRDDVSSGNVSLV